MPWSSAPDRRIAPYPRRPGVRTAGNLRLHRIRPEDRTSSQKDPDTAFLTGNIVRGIYRMNGRRQRGKRSRKCPSHWTTAEVAAVFR